MLHGLLGVRLIWSLIQRRLCVRLIWGLRQRLFGSIGAGRCSRARRLQFERSVCGAGELIEHALVPRRSRRRGYHRIPCRDKKVLDLSLILLLR
jgi:hypothetical protein